MTTLSEYKAMMEGTTDDSVEQSYTFFHTIKEWEALKASREIAPSLIRVIELAENALNKAHNALDHADVPFQPSAMMATKKALSEIRNLKGE